LRSTAAAIGAGSTAASLAASPRAARFVAAPAPAIKKARSDARITATVSARIARGAPPV
jgi:hypothetical protein